MELDTNVGPKGALHPPHATVLIAAMADTKLCLIGMSVEPHGDGLKYRTRWLLS